MTWLEIAVVRVEVDREAAGSREGWSRSSGRWAPKEWWRMRKATLEILVREGGAPDHPLSGGKTPSPRCRWWIRPRAASATALLAWMIPCKTDLPVRRLGGLRCQRHGVPLL